MDPIKFEIASLLPLCDCDDVTWVQWKLEFTKKYNLNHITQKLEDVGQWYIYESNSSSVHLNAPPKSPRIFVAGEKSVKLKHVMIMHVVMQCFAGP